MAHREWVDPAEWVATYGEIISKSKAARLIGRHPAYITHRIASGELREYASGISVRQLAEYQMSRKPRSGYVIL